MENENSVQRPVSSEDTLHHLLRVRLRKNIFLELKVLAQQQSKKVGEYVSISDLVRAAIGSYIQVQRSKDRLELKLNPQRKEQKG